MTGFLLAVAILFQTGALPTQPPALSETITIDLSNAGLSDVLALLRARGVSFVTRESEIEGIRVTIHLQDRPIGEGMSAIAASLDSHWERVGQTFVLRKGAGPNLDKPPVDAGVPASKPMLSIVQIVEIAATLTEPQKARLKQKGGLEMADLTPEQKTKVRALISLATKGT